MFDSEDSKIKEIGGLFIFIILAAVISWVSIYFEVKEALYAFISSLFFIYVIPKSRYSSFKNVIGSYIIASVVALLLLMFVFPLFANLAPLLAEILIVLAVLFISGFLMILLGMEHPPAIAIALFFIFIELATKKIIGLSICFVIILLISLIASKIKGKSGLDSDLGKGDDFGGGLGSFGKDLDIGKDKKLKI